MSTAGDHYLTDEIDPLLLRSSRDLLLAWLLPGATVNVGVGYGTWDEALSKRDAPVSSVDLDPQLITHFREVYPSTEFVHADAFDWAPQAPVSNVVASHLLEHVEHPVALLQRFAGWLTPSGRILICVPNATSIHRRIGKRMGLLKELDELNATDHKLGHVRVYTADLLRQHVDQAGLELVHLSGVTLKALPNSTLAAQPRGYVEACAGLELEPAAAAQLIAVATQAS